MSCPLCEKVERIRGGGDASLVTEMLGTYAVLGDNQGCPGWCVLILKNHAEHFDLLPTEQKAYVFVDLMRIARAIRAAFPFSTPDPEPIRINYECLGNQVGHIHWHVIPRHANDPDPRNAVWGWPAERLKGSMDGPARADLIARLKKALGAT